METKILKPNKETFKLAAKYINNGELVAFPTETVYGLGADATNDTAVKQIFTTKGRPQDNPLIVHLSNKKDIEKYILSISKTEQKIVNKFMPGPISLVLKKNNLISNVVSCNLDTIAIRIPENKVARNFIKYTNKPICAPSANTSKRPSPTTAKDVYQDMKDKIPLIINGGNCNIGVESTVVKCENNIVYILRPGKITKEDLEKSLKTTVIDKIPTENKKIESPGVKYTHYCPSCDMILVKNNKLENFKNLIENYKDKNILVLCSPNIQKELSSYKKDNFKIEILGKNSEEACKNIFRYLRKFEKDFDLILAEFIENGKMQSALYNRMIKSASGREV